MKLQRFKLSMLELFGVMTGAAIAIALILAESIPLLTGFAACVIAIVVTAIAIVLSDVKRHTVLASFVAGCFAVYWLTSSSGLDELVYSLQRMAGSRWQFMWALVRLEASLAIGALCAWVTRSLQPDEPQ